MPGAPAFAASSAWAAEKHRVRLPGVPSRGRAGKGSLETVLLENSGHVATLDVDAPEIFAASARFFQTHADTHPGSTPSTQASSAISSEKQ